MTLYLDPETGEILEGDGTVLGTASGPPYTIPEDVETVLADEIQAARGNSDVLEALAILEQYLREDIEFGRP